MDVAVRPNDVHNYEKRVRDAKRLIKRCEKVSAGNRRLLLKYAEFKGLRAYRLEESLSSFSNHFRQ